LVQRHRERLWRSLPRSGKSSLFPLIILKKVSSL
jgi:hypothetical protein